MIRTRSKRLGKASLLDPTEWSQHLNMAIPQGNLSQWVQWRQLHGSPTAVLAAAQPDRMFWQRMGPSDRLAETGDGFRCYMGIAYRLVA